MRALPAARSLARHDGLPSSLLNLIRWWALGLVFAVWLSGCGGAPTQPLRFSSDFVSGSIGPVTPTDGTGLSWQLALRDDNDNATLPNSYRTWWHVRADNLPAGQPVNLTFTRLGFPYFFVPVYSYDGRNWQHFDEKDVTLAPGCVIAVPESCRITVVKTFEQPTAWIARTFPYTSADLTTFLDTVAPHPAVQLRSLGDSPVLRLPIRLLSIDDREFNGPKRTIWIHARTHAAETGPSFVLEGLIRSVLADDATGRALRERFVWQIVPMHNPDGADLGNYRTNGSSLNLENLWRFTPPAVYLDADAPLENQLLNQGGMVPALQDMTAPVVLALNLHASNAEPDTAAFFYPHFGSDPARFSVEQQRLWANQIALIEAVAREYDGRIEQPPPEGGSGFLNSAFPETWWWAQRQDAVNAITLETVYGRAGFDHWVTQQDLRDLGAALARALVATDGGRSGTGVQSVLRAAPGTVGTPRPSPYRLPFKPKLYQLDRE